jgi:hypothetical protein
VPGQGDVDGEVGEGPVAEVETDLDVELLLTALDARERVAGERGGHRIGAIDPAVRRGHRVAREVDLHAPLRVLCGCTDEERRGQGERREDTPSRWRAVIPIHRHPVPTRLHD